MSDDELELDSYLETLGGGEDDVSLESEKPQKTQPTIKDFGAGTDSDLESFMDNMEIEEYTGEDLSKPWMRYHEFHLITKVAEVKDLIQACLNHGNCALDLETEGFDNRIEYTEKGEPYTRHKIVGYCIGLKGVGYYIPVRHRWNKMFEQSPNVDDVVGTENEVKNLCLASQPEVHPEAAKTDPLGSKEHDGPKVIIKFWHAKFDQEFLYPITGIDWWHPDSFEDGMLASYIIYTDGIHGLKDNAMSMTIQDPNDPEKEYPYEMIKFKDLFPKGSKSKDHKFYLLRPEPKEKSKSGWNCVLYGCSDGICTDLLCDKLVPEATKKKYAGFYRIEKQVIQAVRIMERIRVKIDKSKIVDLLEEAERELRNYEERIIKVAADHGFPNFNPSSSAQLANFLFEDSKGLDIKPKPGKTDQDQYKTDEKTLALYLDKPGAPDVLSWIIKHRQINKVKGTYLENLSKNTDEHDQLRLNFKQTGAATGRFTAPKGDADHGFSGVPIQGIPAKNDPNKPQVAHSLRRMFVARDGYVMAKVDYASQELRIAASVSGEPKWINEYVKELATGIPADLHFLTALAFFPGLKKSDPDFKLKRGAGKTANFALVYGGGVGAVQRATGCDQAEGGRLLKAFHDSVPLFSKWVSKQHRIVKKQRGVRTGCKRFISVPDAEITAKQVMERNLEIQTRKKERDPRHEIRKMSDREAFKEAKRIQAACERKSTNYPIQGSGADILKISLIFLIKEFHLRGWLKNGGDDSVRLVMTVHDEIVFEIRHDRVAEAIPVLKKIMEYPSTLAGWTVPLIAEPELGDSWNAKLDWITMRKGSDPEKHPVPDYLQGKEIIDDPEVIVLSQLKDRKPPPPAASPATALQETQPEAAPAKESETVSVEPQEPEEDDVIDLTDEDVNPPKPPPKAPPVPEKASTDHKRFALFQLGTTYLRKSTVASMATAIQLSRHEAYLSEGETVPLELKDFNGKVLIDHKDGVLVFPQELARRFREYNLGPDTYEFFDV